LAVRAADGQSARRQKQPKFRKFTESATFSVNFAFPFGRIAKAAGTRSGRNRVPRTTVIHSLKEPLSENR
jgi:hypothetical protein